MKTLLPQGFSSYVHSLVSCGYLPISRQVCQKSARNRPHDIHSTFSKTGKRGNRGSIRDNEPRSLLLLSRMHAAAVGSPNRPTGIQSGVSFNRIEPCRFRRDGRDYFCTQAQVANVRAFSCSKKISFVRDQTHTGIFHYKFIWRC